MKETGVRETVWNTGSGRFDGHGHQVIRVGIEYVVSDITASETYLEPLPLINQGSIELLDDKKQTSELLCLEKRKSRTGKDQLTHPQGGHDDHANSLALASVAVARERKAEVPLILGDFNSNLWRPSTFGPRYAHWRD